MCPLEEDGITYKSAVSWENWMFAYAKTKAQISFTVTVKLISTCVFATQIVQFLFFLNPKFQASSLLLWLHTSVCVRPGRKPWRPVFSRHGSSINDPFTPSSLVSRKIFEMLFQPDPAHTNLYSVSTQDTPCSYKLEISDVGKLC